MVRLQKSALVRRRALYLAAVEQSAIIHAWSICAGCAQCLIGVQMISWRILNKYLMIWISAKVCTALAPNDIQPMSTQSVRPFVQDSSCMVGAGEKVGKKMVYLEKKSRISWICPQNLGVAAKNIGLEIRQGWNFVETESTLIVRIEECLSASCGHQMKE